MFMHWFCTTLLMSLQSIFIGVIVIAGFGAAGMLSAVTASEWEEYIDALILCQGARDCDNFINKSSEFNNLVAGIYCYRACQFLVGTSVSLY